MRNQIVLKINQALKLITFFLLIITPALTQAQQIGDKVWVHSFGGTHEVESNHWTLTGGVTVAAPAIQYSAPKGWVITNYKVVELSSNNGWHTSSLMAANSNFLSSQEMEETYDALIDLAGEYDDYNLALNLQNEYNYHSSLYQNYQATHSTLTIQMWAASTGSKFNKVSGWHKIIYDVEILYVGDPNPVVLESQLRARYSIPNNPPTGTSGSGGTSSSTDTNDTSNGGGTTGTPVITDKYGQKVKKQQKDIKKLGGKKPDDTQGNKTKTKPKIKQSKPES